MPEQLNSQVDTTAECDELFNGSVPILQALEALRLRLLDLTMHNRLLNFKHPLGKCIRFVDTLPNTVFRRLMEGSDRKIKIIPIPDPHRADWVPIAGRLTKPEAKDYANRLGIDSSFDLPASNAGTNGAVNIRAPYYSEDLERHCRKLNREMKSALEETGAHMLFLVFGFLEFPEKTDSDRTMISPLISVPVIIEKGELDRDTRHYRYNIVYTGEELSENLSLREKLRTDHGFDLPSFDEEETTPDDYFREIQQTIKNLNGWKVKRHMTLSLLSFSRMLLVRDIDPSKWPSIGSGLSGLTDHPIVRMVFEGARNDHSNQADLGLGNDYNIDEHRLSNIPLIYDADSSQHSALIDALSGRNMVIEGPPGTGKSQTITNLIATAIADGKKVLFLSEKMAALEVVKKRLAMAGLDDFCLELHSNKTQKKRVLEVIDVRKNKQYPLPRALHAQMEALEEKRKVLKAYADLLNSVVGNAQGLTVHALLWRAERFRQGCGDEWQAAHELIVSSAHEFTEAEFKSLHDELVHVSRQYEQIGSFNEDHPFWGFIPKELMPGAEFELERLMLDALPLFKDFQKTFEEALKFLGEKEFNLNPDQAKNLIEALVSTTPVKFYPSMSREILPRIFSTGDPEAKAAETNLRLFDEKLKLVAKLKDDIKDCLKQPNELTSDDAISAEALRKPLAALMMTEMTCQAIDELADEVLHLAAISRQALVKIEECGRVVGIVFDGSEASLKKIKSIIDIAIMAPRDLLKYRHPGFKNPDFSAVIKKASDDLQHINEEFARLSEVFYLDISPSEKQFTEAILVLREGNAWYRIFQSRWRQACQFHRTLDKTKIKKSGPKRLEELERLHHLQKEKNTWNTNQLYKDILGPLYQGENTSFDKAIMLASWLTITQNILIDAGLDDKYFNALDVTEIRLVEISGCMIPLKEAMAELTEGKELLQNRFLDSQVIKEKLKEVTNFPLLVDFLDQLGSQIKNAANKLLIWSPGGVTVKRALQAVVSFIALTPAVRSIDEDNTVKKLLGDEFRSTETNMQTTWDTLIYGRNILTLKLPPSITRMLLSAGVDTNFEKILEYVQNVRKGWDIVERFEQDFTKYGDFQLIIWVGKDLEDAEFCSALIKRTLLATKNINKLLSWVQYLQQTERARERGLMNFISVLESGQVSPGYLPNVFGHRFYSSILLRLFRSYPALQQFVGTTHGTIRSQFASLDRDIIKLRGQECAHKAAEKCAPPPGTSGARVDDKTELSLLNYLLPQVRPKMSIRKMMRQAGRAIQAFKPCFMMGPQAVAQFLEPGMVSFDIVVMDEASQLKPEEAIGAIARGKQLIVVGDPKQLPPTTFFDRLSLTLDDGGDDGQQTAALLSDSILDVCMGHFQPVRTLRWHYRSKHESLIAFSNHNFYKNLIIFPSPYPKGKLLGVHHRYIENGIYKDQMNLTEATHVTDAVINHMLSQPEDSLGVVTLNLKQRDLIEELLEQRFRNLPKTEDYRNQWEKEGMGFFVKNLENVQGDERDVIFISTTFGKTQDANVVRQNFGPISRNDGWRRLNVLFTRARKALQLFTSMRPEDIVVDANTPRGTKVLHDYLEYARTGLLVDIAPTGREAESDFELAVANVLSNHGYEVELQLGVAGFRIDIAVKHPNYLSAYLAAVECDGATYHSGVSVRDRDRIRQEILESLGWKNRIWRIWSTDWFRNPGRETARLISFLNDLKSIPLDGAYFVVPEPIVVPAVEPIRPLEHITLKKLGVSVVETEDDEPEVEVGDTISYCLLGQNSDEIMVHITENQYEPEAGIIPKGHPTAQAMLGAMVNDEFLVKDNRGNRVYVIKKIIKESPTVRY